MCVNKNNGIKDGCVIDRDISIAFECWGTKSQLRGGGGADFMQHCDILGEGAKRLC